MSAIFNTFRGSPDVIGATSATWSYEVTLPHEGDGEERHGDRHHRSGRPGERDPRLDRRLNAVAPTVAIEQPVPMTPPFAVPHGHRRDREQGDLLGHRGWTTRA